MTSEVDISNLALAHLGDSATVTSLSPPEGSAQAEHCSRFYPIARDSLLEQHDWKFNTRREAGALLTEVPLNGWLYAYGMPNRALRVLAVLPPSVNDDYSSTFTIPGYTTASGNPYSYLDAYTDYQPQAYALETLSNGNVVIYTNQPDAVIRFTINLTDSTQFSPLFVDTLSWYLASYLAGPIIKGEAGAAEGQRCLKIAMALMGKATMSDTRNEQVRPKHSVSWINNR